MYSSYTMSARPSAPSRVLIVLAGEDLPLDRLAAWAGEAECTIAADSAGDRLRAIGAWPDYLVGDFDSVRPEGLRARVEVRHDPDAERTDCDKALALAEALGAREATVVGLEGDLLDHLLAGFSSALGSSLRLRFVLRRGLAHLVRGGETLRIWAAESARISVIPLRPTRATLRGVRWELEEALLELGGRVSISNQALGGEVTLAIDSDAALLFESGVSVPRWESQSFKEN